jgi:hypothetical protein
VGHTKYKADQVLAKNHSTSSIHVFLYFRPTSSLLSHPHLPRLIKSDSLFSQIVSPYCLNIFAINIIHLSLLQNFINFKILKCDGNIFYILFYQRKIFFSGNMEADLSDEVEFEVNNEVVEVIPTFVEMGLNWSVCLANG